MGKKLIIVESPTKIKTLKKFLGNDFIIESSVGHIRDLPKKGFGIDFDNNFEPVYEVLDDKKDVIAKLKKAAKQCDEVYLSPDPDREGEAIAWHIAAILPPKTKYKRVTFNSITKDAVLDALKKPRDIDFSLVDAQQARRLLDRIVGYKISPILQRRIKKKSDGGLSAGRVQSVALKLVVDREKEIDAFKPVEYWSIGADLSSNGKPFNSYLLSIDSEKIVKEKEEGKKGVTIPNKEIADKIVSELKGSSFLVKSVEKKERKRNPVPPFTTSTLQQEASRHFGFSATRAMATAQGLYEGVGSEGLITYMRTDSVRVEPGALTSARKYLEKEYGKEYIPAKPNFYSSKKAAQDAHEAIRPTNLSQTPESLRNTLSLDQFKLYQLIWRRFLASQMMPAIYDTVTADVEAGNKILRATGSVIKFKGFLAVYEEKEDEENKANDMILLPPLKVGEKLSLIQVISNQSFTKPPPRFTEASLVKEMEKRGIGRPSTYAATMNKIQSREYTTKERLTIKPTELGKIIAQMLEDYFKIIMDIDFTAHMEDELDEIAENHKNWKEFLQEFWDKFEPIVEVALEEAHVPKIPTDIKCPSCGSTLQKVWSSDKYFYGCKEYPECKFTVPIEALNFKKEDYAENFDWDQNCPKCESNMVIRFGRYGTFLGCSKYPDCKGIVNIPQKGEPTPDEMPDCPAIGCDGKITQRRSRFGKIFFSCTNYPDCDVIGNSLEQLETKYIDHPKTAYVKKPRKGAGKIAAKKGAKKTATKTTKKKAAPKKKVARVQPTYPLSDELIAIVKEKELSRGNVTKKVWDYIKANNLQDEKNKRMIVPDEKLSKVFGHSDSIDMMKLAGLLSKHIKKDK